MLNLCVIPDSCILVSHVLCLDMWHNSAKKIIDVRNIYCSNHIIDEVEKVLETRIQELRSLFDLFILNLLNTSKDFYNFQQLKKYISHLDDVAPYKKIFRIDFILNEICNIIFKVNYPINSFNLYEIFNLFAVDFSKNMDIRKKIMYDQVIIFRNHSSDYCLNISGIENMFHRKNKGGDFDILYDICQFIEISKEKNYDCLFCFVTSDDGFYEGVKSILDEIPLDSVKHLKDIN